tara:strand:+ start:399 stop:1109 length:711 start_codon:yes stop_codon:yes gene_type:complete
MATFTQTTFTVALPEQPYSPNADSDDTFECVYTGPRYVLCQIDLDDDQVREGGRSDSLDDRSIDPQYYEHDIYDYLLIDSHESAEMAMRCAYITHEYTHPDVEDYEEEITCANGTTWTWTHQYEGTTGMLAHLHWSESLTYNSQTNTWAGPVLREHVNSRQSVLDSCTEQARVLDLAVADETCIAGLSASDIALLKSRSVWLKEVAADVRYAGINHWKIPFPEAPLPHYELPEANG